MAELKKIYDNVYTNIPQYDGMFKWKIEVIDKVFENFDKSIKVIDVGCGKGHYLKNLLDHDFKNVLGVEFSSVCSEKFLSELPHVNADFLTYSSNIKDCDYDVCLCMDVLEHIQYEKLDEFLNSVERISKESILGIANHSDIFLGNELHLVQEDSVWWYNMLKKFYNNIEEIYQLENKKFFIFRCCN